MVGHHAHGPVRFHCAINVIIVAILVGMIGMPTAMYSDEPAGAAAFNDSVFNNAIVSLLSATILTTAAPLTVQVAHINNKLL